MAEDDQRRVSTFKSQAGISDQVCPYRSSLVDRVLAGEKISGGASPTAPSKDRTAELEESLPEGNLDGHWKKPKKKRPRSKTSV
jgi:hypothetical protein